MTPAAWVRDAVITLAVLLISPVAQASANTSPSNPTPPLPLLLDVTLNDCRLNLIGEFVLHGDELLATQAELERLGLKTHASEETRHDTLIALSSLPDVRWQYDHAAQSVALIAPSRCLISNNFSALPLSAAEFDQASTGFVLNYDLFATATDTFGKGSAVQSSGLFEARLFLPRGVLQNHFATMAGPSGTRIWRLDSRWQVADPARMRRAIVGDFVTRGLTWTRSLRMGGLALQTDFGLQPERIMFPLPTITGTTAVPTSLDLLVNGSRAFERALPAGPFEIRDIPVVNGAGAITMRIIDMLGRQQEMTIPFYASTQLLQPGLSDYAVQIGALRHNWGLSSWDYRNAALVANIRHGINRYLTLEGHVEGTANVRVAGFGGVLQLGRLATMSLAPSGSWQGQRSGAKLAFALQRIAPQFQFGVNGFVASNNYRDIAGIADRLFPQEQVTAFAGIASPRFGNVQIAFNQGRWRDLQQSGMPPTRVSILNGSYLRQFNRFAVQAAAFHDFANSGAYGGRLTITVTTGSRSMASASAGISSGRWDGRLDASRITDAEGDVGYQLQAMAGDQERFLGTAQYRASWGLISGGVDQIGSSTNLRFGARGSLVVMPGLVTAGNTIVNSVAVVEAGGLPGLRVLRENREVGRTNAKGRLLVPDLRAYQANAIALEIDDLPVDATLDRHQVTVRPREFSGVRVKFDVKLGTSALLKLVDERARFVSVGTTVRLESREIAQVVGEDGAVYLEDLRAGVEYRAKATLPQGKNCFFAFVFQPQSGRIADLDKVTCREQR